VKLPILRSRLAIFVALVLALLWGPVPHAARAEAIYPNSIASTGDSITRAFNTGSYFADAPANSWSTGTSSTVNPFYRRILAVNPAISGRAYNDARTSAKMLDLAGQMTTVNTRQVEYVTILMGANDVCTSSESTMTSVTAFRTQFQNAMNIVTAGSPNARVYVVSIPNIYNLWSVLRNNSSARFTWSLFGICKSMLANPSSTRQADIDRRLRVRQRNIDFNTQLQQVCSQYPRCRFDNNAVFNTAFVASDVSTRDYFHPSLAGQAKLATVAWGASEFGP
jgi:lysophospholipase L1-like esterase